MVYQVWRQDSPPIRVTRTINPRPSQRLQDHTKRQGLMSRSDGIRFSAIDHGWSLPPDDCVNSALTQRRNRIGNIFSDPPVEEPWLLWEQSMAGHPSDIIGAGPVTDFPDGAPTVGKSKSQFPLKSRGSVDFRLSSSPEGHGFSQSIEQQDLPVIHLNRIGYSDKGH